MKLGIYVQPNDLSIVHRIEKRNSTDPGKNKTNKNTWKETVCEFLFSYLFSCVLLVSKFHHITPVLKSVHRLKINERIKYKVLSLTYKSLKTGQPSYLRSLLSFPSHRCTRSSFLITLSRPSLTSRLKIANRPFYPSTPVLWNNLPSHLRQVVHHVTPSPISNSPLPDFSTCLFLKNLKTHLFHSSFPP